MFDYTGQAALVIELPNQPLDHGFDVERIGPEGIRGLPGSKPLAIA